MKSYGTALTATLFSTLRNLGLLSKRGGERLQVCDISGKKPTVDDPMYGIYIYNANNQVLKLSVLRSVFVEHLGKVIPTDAVNWQEKKTSKNNL